MEPGDVFKINLKGEGHEQKGLRPIIVVQDAEAGLLSTRLCVPTSTSAPPSGWRVPVTVEGEETLALVEQLRVISTERLKQAAGTISLSELAEIRAIAWALLGYRG